MPSYAHCSIVCCSYFRSYTPKKPLHPFTCGITCILLHALPSAEVVAFVYMHTLAYLLHALPLEEALASVHVRSILFFLLSDIMVLLTPCAELRSLHDECRATLTALLCAVLTLGATLRRSPCIRLLAVSRAILTSCITLSRSPCIRLYAHTCHFYFMHYPWKKPLHPFMCATSFSFFLLTS